jgi:hypothetical protein
MRSRPARPRRDAVFVALVSLFALAACTDTTEPGSIALSVVSPGPLMVNQGLTSGVELAVSRAGKVSGPVSLAVSGTPGGVLATLAPSSLAEGTSSSQLLVSVTSGAVPGMYPLSIRASANGVAEVTLTLTLTVLPPVSVTISPAYLSLAPGATHQFSAFVTGTANTAVTWSSSAPAIATVSASGLVTATGEGQVTITARSVVDPARFTEAYLFIVPVSVRISPPEATMIVGRTLRFFAVVSGSSNMDVLWTSSAPDVASVDAGGIVTALKPGIASITARAAVDPTKSATAQVTVIEPLVPVQVTSGVPLTVSGATGSEIPYRITVPAGATRLTVSTSGGTGDVDIVLRFGTIPVPGEPYACLSYADGNVDSCNVTNPAAGEWFFYLLGYQAYTGVTLLVTVTP